MEVYTVNGFRKRMKEALDKVSDGEEVGIDRNGVMYIVTLGSHVQGGKDVHGSSSVDLGDLSDKLSKVMSDKKVSDRYGCGCDKEDGKYLCKKHQRI